MKFTWLIRIVVPLALAVYLNAACHAKEVGSIQGIVRFVGEIPLASLANDRGVKRPILTVDRRTGGLADTIVFLTPVDKPLPHAKPTTTVRPPRVTVVDQLEMEFKPRVLAVRAGDTVRFTNSDAANHNVRAQSLVPENQFNVLTGAAQAYEHRFRTERGARPIKLGCDIHVWMSAWIFVFDHDHFTATNGKGRFTLLDIPAGKYRLDVRQPDGGLKATREIVVSAQSAAELEIEFQAADLEVP